VHRNGHRRSGRPADVRLILSVAVSFALLASGVSAASARRGPAATLPTLADTPAPTVTQEPGVYLDIEATPNPAYVGGTSIVTFTVTLVGENLAQSVWVAPDLPTGVPSTALPTDCEPLMGCPLGDLYNAGDMASFEVTLSPTVAGQYPISGQATGYVVETLARPAAFVRGESEGLPREAQPEVTTILNVLQPSISLLPPVGSPGTVTLVYGTDFPPGEPIDLAWDPGITAAAVPPVVGPGGIFVAQMLIIGGDQTGVRNLDASGAGFTPVTQTFLVTKPRLLPPLLGAGNDIGTGTGTGTGQ
jgi:hypothetical protein